MTTQVQEIYAKVYEALQEDMDEVLRQHAIKRIEQRIVAAEQRVKQWEAKYGADYKTFARRTATDESYLQQLEANPDSQMWEGDLFEWEYEVEVLAEWRSHYQRLLQTS